MNEAVDPDFDADEYMSNKDDGTYGVEQTLAELGFSVPERTGLWCVKEMPGGTLAVKIIGMFIAGDQLEPSTRAMRVKVLLKAEHNTVPNPRLDQYRRSNTTLRQYLEELMTAMQTDDPAVPAQVDAIQNKWVAVHESEESDMDMDDEEPVRRKPVEDPDFDADEYMTSPDVNVTTEREQWVKKQLTSFGGDDIYYVPLASSGGDFRAQANFSYLKDKYSFFNYTAGVVGFSRKYLKNTHPAEDALKLYQYLERIDDDTWETFRDDVNDCKGGESLDDTKEAELRIAAEGEYWKDITPELKEAWQALDWARDSYITFLIQCLSTDDIEMWLAQNDFYPEDEGDGSVYMDIEPLVQAMTPEDLLNIADNPARQKRWMRLKQLVLNQKEGPLDKFDKEMRAALVDRPDLQPIYARMDSREMQNFFNDLLEHPPEKAGNQYPRWVRLEKSYYNSVPTHWEIMYPMASRDWHAMLATDREEYLANGMKKFVRDYGLPALKTRGYTVIGHPEFKFEAVEDPDFDANEYMHMIPFGACRNCSADLTLPYTVVRYYTPRGEGAAQGFCYGHTTTEGEYEPDGLFSGGDITQFDLHANSDFCTRCGLSLTEDETAPPVEEALEDPDFDANECMSSVDLPTFKDWLKAKSFVTRPGGAERTDDLGNIQVIRIRGQWEFRTRNRGVFRYVRVDDADDATLIAALEDFISKIGIQETVDRLLEDDPDFDADDYMASEGVGFLLASVQGAWIYEPTEDMILKFCKTNSSTSRGAFERHEGPLYYIVPKETGKGNFLLGVAEEGRLYAPPYRDSRAVADQLYKAYPGLRRFFHKVAKELIDRDYTARGIRLMAQLYGPKAILRYVDDYNVPVDLRFRVGVEAAVTGKLDDAAALLKISVQQLTVKGAKWLLRDDSELAKLFDKNEQWMAKEAINGEFDASGAYDVDLELDEIVSALRDEDYAAIRELLPYRTVYPYEDEQPLRLSTQNLQEFGNEDIADWLRDKAMEIYDINGELQDIRKALDSAAHSALEHVMVDVATEAYKEAALSAIGGELAYTEKGTVLFVPWKIIDIWLSNEDVSEAGDLDDLLWYYSPRAAAPEDCYDGAGWDEQECDPFYSELENALDVLEMPAYPYDSKQLTMPEIMGDDPSEIVEVPYYGPHTPHGYSLRLRRMDTEKRKKMEEPWHFDKDLWQQHARETGFEIPPATGVGESVANTLLEQEYNYASTQIDVPAEQGDFLFEWGRLNIPDERLQVADPDDNPRELQHHVTVKFGLTVNDVPEELRAICKEIQPFPVYIGKVSLFHNQGFDVVKLDVESPWLRELNAKISAAVPNEDTHPTYIPHITVAYVKPGSCDELDGVDIFQGDESGVSPEFVAYGLAFKGAGEDGGPRTEENLLFSRIKKKVPAGPSESEPFSNLPFPLDPAHTAQFLQATRSRARREIL